MMGIDAPKIILMEHVNANGKPNIVKECTKHLGGKYCCDKLITDMAVFEFKDGEMWLTEIAPGLNVDDVRRCTEPKFNVKKGFTRMNFS